MSYEGTTPLFAPGPNPRTPALPWRSDSFYAIDDRVRGGTSHSHTAIVQYPPPSRGEVIFSGFLDTLTLGGAGFSSQASTTLFPVTLSKDAYSGLRLVVRKQANWNEPIPPSDADKNPGGGKRPVKSFVFEIKTEEPQRRPDGRRESVVVWEWSFTIPSDQSDIKDKGLNTVLSNDDFWVFDGMWDDFRPFYRGRPIDPDTAGEFEPEKTYEWSLMARSHFQAQSGPFALQLHSLNALPFENQLSACRAHATSVVTGEAPTSGEIEPWLHEKSSGHSFRSVAPAQTTPVKDRSTGEYYGFALFVFSTVLWIGWIAWALTPDEWLESVGIAWYPNREWAFLIPAWSLFAVLAVYAVFIGLNNWKTPELDEISNVTDRAQNVYTVSLDDEKHLFEDQHKLEHSLHDIYDLPPTYVSRQMHLS
ncbi:uncharacterized protein MEPE_03415 [Melanopsichium pennsylvanicum]|uniref:CIA30-domain-containing protein n=2 Tax=Melanopsichium pennsylvanicum TaxID=63383 RepID=A0AAJ5C5G0_9BASI|nr:conserved hypothetical protein [Melanopsichium pennsylvanicum 4]SNX84706.1 uncharacterized protein MEPE_03415 [Melanopsichium pennsylvanicum]